MRKTIIKILIFLLITGILSILPFHIHDHEHVVMIEAADYGTCTNCGTGVYVEVFVSATCIENGWIYTECNNCHTEGPTIETPALGHNFVLTSSTPATCTASGVNYYTCSRCGEADDETTAALGHSYSAKVTKAATCTEGGLTTYTCTRCNDSYQAKTKALGHKFEYEEKEATCTEEGYKNGKCIRCGKEEKETFPALGHEIDEYKVTREATCEEDGLKEAVCKRCGETVEETIPKLGHDLPEEWTLVKKATVFSEGKETKTCSVCGAVIEQTIPKLSPVPLLSTGVGLAAAAGGAYYLLTKLKKRAYSNAEEEGHDPFKPSYENKIIVACTKDSKLIDTLKGRHYLEVKICEYDELDEIVEDAGPDLLIIDIPDEEILNDVLAKKEETLKDIALGFITGKGLSKKILKKLDQLKEDKELLEYLPEGSSPFRMMTKMVLPVLKPKLNSDESLANIGSVADLLGIPHVSKVIDLYVTGRDIKATLEEDEMGISEHATLISDIASILGLDKVTEVAGLVDDIDAIKAVISKDAGAYEVKKAYQGAKDVIDVADDLLDKDD